MKKLYILMLIAVNASSANPKPLENHGVTKDLHELINRCHKILDKIEHGFDLLHRLWKPFPKAIALSHQYPFRAIACSCLGAYLYHKEKKAFYTYAALIYCALYYRIQENTKHGLAARNFLREREALVIPEGV